MVITHHPQRALGCLFLAVWKMPFSLWKKDDQLLMQQKSCQKCPSSTWEFIPPAVPTRSRCTSSHNLHLLFTYQTWVKPTTLTFPKGISERLRAVSFLGLLLREAKGCFCVKEFVARWGMTWRILVALIMCSAATNFPESDLILWYENTEEILI